MRQRSWFESTTLVELKRNFNKKCKFWPIVGTFLAKRPDSSMTSPNWVRCAWFVAVMAAAPACKQELPPRKVDPDQQKIAGVLQELERTKPPSTTAHEVALEDLPPIPQIVLDEDLQKEAADLNIEPATAVEIREFRVGQPTVTVESQAPPPVAEPVSQLRSVCLAASTACDGRTLRNDACIRDLPTCSAMPASATDNPCCPEQCLLEYAKERRQGISTEAAMSSVFGAAVHPCLEAFAAEMGAFGLVDGANEEPAAVDTPETDETTENPALPPTVAPNTPKVIIDRVRTYVDQGINGVPRLVQIARDAKDPDAPRALLGLAEIGGPAGRAALRDIAESDPTTVDPMLIEAAKSLLERAMEAGGSPEINDETDETDDE